MFFQKPWFRIQFPKDYGFKHASISCENSQTFSMGACQNRGQAQNWWCSTFGFCLSPSPKTGAQVETPFHMAGSSLFLEVGPPKMASGSFLVFPQTHAHSSGACKAFAQLLSVCFWEDSGNRTTRFVLDKRKRPVFHESATKYCGWLRNPFAPRSSNRGPR